MEKELLCILKKYETHPDFLGDTIKDINQVGGMDDTVLHIAARNNSLNDALVFLQNGALIDLKGDLGYTPLHYACMFGNIEMVKLLLDNGSDKIYKMNLEKMPLELQLTHPAKIKRR